MEMLKWVSGSKTRNEHVSEKQPAPPSILSDLRRGVLDETGYPILDIYARKLPEYVVYRNRQRVAVQYADLRSDASAQRKMMATLNPLRGEINGLIDGWRLKKDRSGAQRRAERFDRRVADAMVAALEGDVSTAVALLTKIKQDIVDERTAWARFQYLIVALSAGVVGTLIAFAMVRWGGLPHVSDDLYQAAGAGLIGAFFSIALAIRGRTVLPDLQWIANAMDAALRMLVGLIGAGVLVAMVDAHMVNVTFGLPAAPAAGVPLRSTPSEPPNTRIDAVPPAAPASPTPQDAANRSEATDAGLNCGVARCSDQAWLNILIFGFVAGFSERFVPDLLAKAGATAPAPDSLPLVPRTPINVGNASVGKKSDDEVTALPADKSPSDPEPDDEAHDDNCVCDTPLDETQATADEHLPAASGGVAVPNAA